MRRSLAEKIMSAWTEPKSRGIDLDATGSISVHREIIAAKPLLQRAYRNWYNQLQLLTRPIQATGTPIIELGCGASHLQEFIPGLIRTDVVAHENVDQVVDAGNMPFINNSLGAIVMLNVFHHLPDPAKFLREVQRCLIPKGRMVAIEPSNSFLSQFIVNHFHRTEFWDGNVPEWTNATTGRLSNANNALPWIVFERDREKFHRLFPGLRVSQSYRHSLGLYYLSGGLSYRPVLPNWIAPFISKVEILARPIERRFGTMMTIVVEKL